jgi:hypothetical protein
MTSAGACNNGQTVESLLHIALGVAQIQRLLTQIDFCSDTADPTSIGVYDTTADLDTRLQPKLARSLFAKISDYFTRRRPEAILAELSIIDTFTGALDHTSPFTPPIFLKLSFTRS